MKDLEKASRFHHNLKRSLAKYVKDMEKIEIKVGNLYTNRDRDLVVKCLDVEEEGDNFSGEVIISNIYHKKGKYSTTWLKDSFFDYEGDFLRASLKSGMAVKLRNGKICYVIKDFDNEDGGYSFIFISKDGIIIPIRLDIYLKDRNENTQLDVMEVYKGRGFKLLSFEPGELLWKRAIPRLTKADLEKIVGYEFELAED